jgi:glycosyltransferase involved in cell wall biosynthesis
VQLDDYIFRRRSEKNMRKYKVLVCGAFDFINLPTGGQPVKSRAIYHALCNTYGQSNVIYEDTYGWKKHPVRLFYHIVRKTRSCDNVIILPAHNGLKVFAVLFYFLKKIYDFRLFYDVIGGWLAEDLKKTPILLKCLKVYDGIWVETTSMKEALENLGLDNIYRIRNFKLFDKEVIPHVEYNLSDGPLRVCTFSRVMPEKGIEDVIEVVNRINQEEQRNVYSLDIYGHIDESYAQRFNLLKESFSETIRYMGIANPSDSITILRGYFALLFPTRFMTEGVPGTIIDAYAAGIPVISARWQNSKDVIEEGKTGLCYEMYNVDELYRLMVDVAKAPLILSNMRKNCSIKYKEFDSSTVMSIINTYLK